MLCHSWALLCNATASPNVALPTQCLTLLCRNFTALIGSDQYHAEAHLSSTVPTPVPTVQCQRSSSPRLFGSLTLIAIPMLSHSMPRRIVSMPDRSYLCHSDTWLNSTIPLRLNALLCQCSATPLVCYSIPKPSAPLLCPSMASLRLALAPFFFAMPLLYCSTPLLRYARLDLSVQCLGDSSPCLCSTYLRSALAILVNAIAFRRYSSPLRR